MANTQINRAITTGNDKGYFVLPKGISGKVKLGAKARADVAKEVRIFLTYSVFSFDIRVIE